uniref:Uncharacterized protein n=1 Tax=Arundo donax TaxID=35708 RepID=A0A0A9FSU1_ARUDO
MFALRNQLTHGILQSNLDLVSKRSTFF